MMVYLYAYLATLAVFLPCDMVWLSTMASRLYKPTLGDILLGEANLGAAGAFYAVYPIGMAFFAVVPALRAGSLTQATLSGALFGFFTYMTYDLTNQATLKNWTTQLTLVDLGWGTVLGAISATAAFWLTSKFTG